MVSEDSDTSSPPSPNITAQDTTSVTNEAPVPLRSKRPHVSSPDEDSDEVETVEPAERSADMILVGPVRILAHFFYFFVKKLFGVLARKGS